MWRSLRDACRDAPFGTNQRYITWLKDVRRKVRLAGPDGRITRRISDENYGRLVRAAAGFSLRRERERRWALRADCREDGQARGYDAPELIRRQGVVRAFKGFTAAQRKCWRILGGFSFERRNTVSKSIRAEESEPSPYSHQLQQFLAFLKQERGFADATIVNRKRSPALFLAGLVGQSIPLSAVSPSVIIQVLHRCRGQQVEAGQRIVSCAVSAFVLSVCPQSGVGARRTSPLLSMRRASTRRKICLKGRHGKR